MSRQTHVIIHLERILHNYQLANQWAPNSKNIAVIKANAYGHGLLKVADYLQPHVSAFGVAIIDEAIELRQAGITKPILVLQGVTSADDLQQASNNDLWLTLHHSSQLDCLLKTKLAKPIKLWLKFDSGMHRIGMNQLDVLKAYKKLKECAWVEPAIVVSSHFSCATEIANPETGHQMELFDRLVNSLPEKVATSLANSAALAHFYQSHREWNRPGIMLYGLPLFNQPHESDRQLKPSMTFRAPVIALRKIRKGEAVGYDLSWRASKDSKIATIAVGYADGYPRQAKNGTPVYVNGAFVPLVGRVSMDMISIDVSDLESVAVGDYAELWGGNCCANRVAKWADTIGYDLITGISHRVVRRYQQEK